MSINSKAAPVVFNNVTKVYGKDVVAVDNINLKIEAGKLVTLLGPSGCGKTTTLRMIAGLEMATKGSIFIGDSDVTLLPATDRDVSMVFQSYALFPHMSVMENVAYGLGFSGFDKSSSSALRLHELWYWNRKFCFLTSPCRTLMQNSDAKFVKKSEKFSKTSDSQSSM
jgi:iron(III) transport system ATP-binding protein